MKRGNGVNVGKPLQILSKSPQQLSGIQQSYSSSSIISCVNKEGNNYIHNLSNISEDSSKKDHNNIFKLCLNNEYEQSDNFELIRDRHLAKQTQTQLKQIQHLAKQIQQSVDSFCNFKFNKSISDASSDIDNSELNGVLIEMSNSAFYNMLDMNLE